MEMYPPIAALPLKVRGFFTAARELMRDFLPQFSL